MWNNGHDAYLENRVLSADPVELVNLLYQACMQAIRDARLHLAERRIMERARAITRACEITFELTAALDHERGGEISQRLTPHGAVRHNDFVLKFWRPPYEITLFPDGRAIIKGTTDTAVARSLYARYVGS